MFLKEQNKIWIAESIITPYGEVRKDGWDPKQRADALLCSAFTSCNKESVRGGGGNLCRRARQFVSRQTKELLAKPILLPDFLILKACFYCNFHFPTEKHWLLPSQSKSWQQKNFSCCKSFDGNWAVFSTNTQVQIFLMIFAESFSLISIVLNFISYK